MRKSLIKLSLIATIQASKISITTSTSQRGSLLPEKTKTPITTTIDVPQVTVIENDPEITSIASSAPPTNSPTTSSTSIQTPFDSSTELPPRWFPRRKFASSAEPTSKAKSLNLLILLFLLVALYLL